MVILCIIMPDMATFSHSPSRYQCDLKQFAKPQNQTIMPSQVHLILSDCKILNFESKTKFQKVCKTR